jgi:hypothetical protein
LSFNTTEIGLNWQVRDSEAMLFHKAKGPQYPEQCRTPSVKVVKRQRLLEYTDTYKEAQAACAGKDEEAIDSWET